MQRYMPRLGNDTKTIKVDPREVILPVRTVNAVGKENLDDLIYATNGRPPNNYYGGYADGGMINGVYPVRSTYDTLKYRAEDLGRRIDAITGYQPQGQQFSVPQQPARARMLPAPQPKRGDLKLKGGYIGGYADGGRISGWNVDRTAIIDRAVSGALGEQQPAAPAQNTGPQQQGGGVQLSEGEQFALDQARAAEAANAAANPSGWKRFTGALGFADGGAPMDSIDAWNASVGVPDPTMYRNDAKNMANVMSYIKDQGGSIGSGGKPSAADVLAKFQAGQPITQQQETQPSATAQPTAPTPPVAPTRPRGGIGMNLDNSRGLSEMTAPRSGIGGVGLPSLSSGIGSDMSPLGSYADGGAPGYFDGMTEEELKKKYPGPMGVLGAFGSADNQNQMEQNYQNAVYGSPIGRPDQPPSKRYGLTKGGEQERTLYEQEKGLKSMYPWEGWFRSPTANLAADAAVSAQYRKVQESPQARQQVAESMGMEGSLPSPQNAGMNRYLYKPRAKQSQQPIGMPENTVPAESQEQPLDQAWRYQGNTATLPGGRGSVTFYPGTGIGGASATGLDAAAMKQANENIRSGTRGGGTVSSVSGPGAMAYSKEEWDNLTPAQKSAANVAYYNQATQQIREARNANRASQGLAPIGGEKPLSVQDQLGILNYQRNLQQDRQSQENVIGGRQFQEKLKADDARYTAALDAYKTTQARNDPKYVNEVRSAQNKLLDTNMGWGDETSTSYLESPLKDLWLRLSSSVPVGTIDPNGFAAYLKERIAAEGFPSEQEYAKADKAGKDAVQKRIDKIREDALAMFKQQGIGR